MNGYKAALGKYAQFSGRSRRAEYWSFVLINALIEFVLYALVLALGTTDSGFNAVGWILTALLGVYVLFILIPTLALQWRRYQDIGWAGALSIIGWFIPLLTLIVAFIPGNPGPNQYGDDPKF